MYRGRAAEVETTPAYLPPALADLPVDLLVLKSSLAAEQAQSERAIAPLEDAEAKLNGPE